jgi:hypothetical protein
MGPRSDRTRILRRRLVLLVVLLTTPLAHARPAVASASPSRPAAIEVFPYVVVDTANGIDTLVQLTNVSGAPVTVHCFYTAVDPSCVDGQPGENCTPDGPACSGDCELFTGAVDFRVIMTTRQPIAWWASTGQTEFALDGHSRVGPDGSSNAGSRVPPTLLDGGVSRLRCVATDSNDFPVASNALIGSATVERVAPQTLDIAAYPAIGFPSLDGTGNGDPLLVLGGPDAEYEGCPNFLILNHFFEGATLRLTPSAGGEQTREVATSLVLAPCGEDYGNTTPPPRTTTQLTVFDEFGMRMSAKLILTNEAVLPLASLGANGIFSMAMRGTLTGQTRILGDAGLLGFALQTLRDPTGAAAPHTAALSFGKQGDRADADFVSIEPGFYTVTPAPSPTPDAFEPDDVPAEAKPIGCFDVQTHSIDRPGDRDWLAFSLAEPMAVRIETQNSLGDTTLDLRKRDGTQVAVDDDSGGGVLSLIARECNAPLPSGLYLVQVGEFGDDATIASYDLELDCFPCPPTPTASATSTPTPTATAAPTTTGTPAATFTPTMIETVPATATPGACCSANGGRGCERSACAACVCAIDEVCCREIWDGSCAVEAAGVCNDVCQCQTCPGDCDGNHSVGVNELILGVNIALGAADAAQCRSIDVNHDGDVSVGELVGAVNRALNGC